MKTTLLLLLSAFVATSTVQGQTKKTAVTAALLGNTLAGINVHQSVAKFVDYTGAQTGFLDLSVGVGSAGDRLYTLPHGVTANLGAKGNYFEVGYAGTYFAGPEPKQEPIAIGGIPPCGCKGNSPAQGDYLPAILLGYRRQAPSGFVVRANASLLLADSIFWRVMPGLSLGWSF
jgi:hypothetical protein